MGRSDYGPEEVSNFRKQIVEQVVPIVSKLHEQKKDILGLDKLYFYDGINFIIERPMTMVLLFLAAFLVVLPFLRLAKFK